MLTKKLRIPWIVYSFAISQIYLTFTKTNVMQTLFNNLFIIILAFCLMRRKCVHSYILVVYMRFLYFIQKSYYCVKASVKQVKVNYSLTRYHISIRFSLLPEYCKHMFQYQVTLCDVDPWHLFFFFFINVDNVQMTGKIFASNLNQINVICSI